MSSDGIIIINRKNDTGQYLKLIFDGGYYCTFEISSYYYELLGTDMCVHTRNCSEYGFGIYRIMLERINEDIKNYNERLGRMTKEITYPLFGAFGDIVVPKYSKQKLTHKIVYPVAYNNIIYGNRGEKNVPNDCNCKDTIKADTYYKPNIIISLPRTDKIFSFAVRKISNVQRTIYRISSDDGGVEKCICNGFAKVVSDDDNFISIGYVYTRQMHNGNSLIVPRVWGRYGTCSQNNSDYKPDKFTGIQSGRPIQDIVDDKWGFNNYYVVNKLFLMKDFSEGENKKLICWVNSTNQTIGEMRFKEQILTLTDNDARQDPLNGCEFRNKIVDDRVIAIIPTLEHLNPNSDGKIKELYEPYFYPALASETDAAGSVKNFIHKVLLSLIPMTFQDSIPNNIFTVEKSLINRFKNPEKNIIDGFKPLHDERIYLSIPADGDNYPIINRDFVKYFVTRDFIDYLLNSFCDFNVNFNTLPVYLKNVYLLYFITLIETACPQIIRKNDVNKDDMIIAYKSLIYFINSLRKYLLNFTDKNYVKYINDHKNIQYLITIQTHTERIIFVDFWADIIRRYCKNAKYIIDDKNPFLIQPSICACNSTGANEYDKLIQTNMPQKMKDIQRLLTHNQGYNCTLKICQNRTIEFLPSNDKFDTSGIEPVSYRELSSFNGKSKCPRLCVQDINIDIKKSYLSDILQYCGDTEKITYANKQPDITEITNISTSIPNSTKPVIYVGIFLFIMLIVSLFIVLMVIYIPQVQDNNKSSFMNDINNT